MCIYIYIYVAQLVIETATVLCGKNAVVHQSSVLSVPWNQQLAPGRSRWLGLRTLSSIQNFGSSDFGCASRRNRQTNKQTNKQANKQTNKQIKPKPTSNICYFRGGNVLFSVWYLKKKNHQETSAKVPSFLYHQSFHRLVRLHHTLRGPNPGRGLGSNMDPRWGELVWSTLPEANGSPPENRPKPNRKGESIPTIHFQGRSVSFREGICRYLDTFYG